MTEGSRLQKQHPVDAETSVSDGDGVAKHSQRGYARLAGLMYLLVLVFDIAGMVVVSAVRGSGGFLDASHTIVAWEPLYRLGLLLGLAGSLCTIPLAVGLYVALRPIDGNLALMGLLFRMVEAATGAMGTSSAFATLQIYLAANHPGGFEPNQLGTLVDFSPSGVASYVAAIFFCVGSAIFFSLFLTSAYIPRILAAWGVFASLVYLAAFVASLIDTSHSGTFLGIGSVPILIAEACAGLWLLVRGVQTHPRVPRPAGSSARGSRSETPG